MKKKSVSKILRFHMDVTAFLLLLCRKRLFHSLFNYVSAYVAAAAVSVCRTIAEQLRVYCFRDSPGRKSGAVRCRSFLAVFGDVLQFQHFAARIQFRSCSRFGRVPLK